MWSVPHFKVKHSFCVYLQIIFEAIRGPSLRSDIAIDDIYFKRGRCEGTVSESSRIWPRTDVNYYIIRHCYKSNVVMVTFLHNISVQAMLYCFIRGPIISVLYRPPDPGDVTTYSGSSEYVNEIEN